MKMRLVARTVEHKFMRMTPGGILSSLKTVYVSKIRIVPKTEREQPMKVSSCSPGSAASNRVVESVIMVMVVLLGHTRGLPYSS